MEERSAGRTNHFARRFPLLQIAAAMCVAFLSNATIADVVNVNVGGSTRHDTNLFKRPDAVAQTVNSGYVGLRVDKPYSLQRFQFDVSATAYRYSDLSYLDFDGLDYRAAWLWSVTPRLSGSLRSERSETQVPFFDFNSLQRNGLHATFGLSESKQVSSQPFLAQPDFKLYSAELGLKYSRIAGNSIALLQRRGQGEYLRNQNLLDPTVPLDTKYDQNETELQIARFFSRSTFLGKLNWTERHHDQLSQLNSSGWSGDLTYTWNATDKLTANLAVRQIFVPYFGVAVTTSAPIIYRIDKGASAGLKWQPTGSIALSLDVSGVHSYFSSGVSTTLGDARRDETSFVSGNLG